MKLRNIIDAKGLEYGSTPPGSAWCVKALHPADALSECRGIPDHSNLPSVHMGYESVQTLTPPAGAAGSWGFDMAVTPHPVSFSWAHTYGENDPLNGAYISHLNPQLDAGTTHQAKYDQWKSIAQRWRLTYCGVTIRQDAASVANQGVIVACQAPISLAPVVANQARGAWLGILGHAMCVGCTASDMPEFGRVQSMPQSYHGLSKDGLYMPVRLSDHTVWHGEHDEAVNWGPVQQFGPERGSGSYQEVGQNPGSSFPYEGLSTPFYDPGDAVWCQGDVTSALCNGFLGNVCARNLALTTRISITYRFGFEIQVQPGTLLSPQQQLSPAYDARALETYNAISRELSDAYPEEYNSLSKIWDVIRTIGKAVLPAIAENVPIVSEVYKIAKGVARTVDSARVTPADEAVARRAVASEQPSLAEKERAKRVISAAQRRKAATLVVKRRK